MIYVLDTNAVIAFLNGAPVAVRQRLVRAREAAHSVALSSVSMHELWYGVAKSAKKSENAEALRKLSAQGFDLLIFDEVDAETSGLLRGELEAAGTPIGPYDLLIAAQALRRGATLVTANEREFARVKGLKQVNWAA